MSPKRYTELRFATSDLVQREDWKRLFQLCSTQDPEQAMTTATIFANFFDPKRIWRFVKFVSKLKTHERRESRNSVATVCYTLGKIGGSNTKLAISELRKLLADDSMLENAVTSSLSNIWIFDTKICQGELLSKWVLRSGGNETIEETAVRSSEYLLSQNAEMVDRFLSRVSRLENHPKAAGKANELLAKYLSSKVRQSKSTERKKKS